MTNSSFDETLTEVWRQALVENATAVELDGNRYAVRRTPKRHLRQVDFVFDIANAWETQQKKYPQTS